eukprot:11198456-Lingulodinium_polyedra.AAC.1
MSMPRACSRAAPVSDGEEMRAIVATSLHHASSNWTRASGSVPVGDPWCQGSICPDCTLRMRNGAK